MKRFSAREFALLCLPVAVVAGAGFWASRKPAPKLYAGPQLRFSTEAPRAMQAFDGVESVLQVEVDQDSLGTNYSVLNPRLSIGVATNKAVETWSWGTSKKSSLPRTLSFRGRNDFDISITNNSFYEVAPRGLPEGKVTFGFVGRATPSGKLKYPTLQKPVFLQQQWVVDRAKTKRFNFSIPRSPQISLQSVTITENKFYEIKGKATFVMENPTMSAEKLLEIQLRPSTEKPDHHDWQIEVSPFNFQPAQVFSTEFRLTTSNMTSPEVEKPRLILVAGRISADNRWPLEFEFEPIDRLKTKVGQQLKFKSWPAPLPPNAKN